MITQEYLKSVVNYDPETGIFLMRPQYVSPDGKYRNGRKPHGVVGGSNGLGYLVTSFNGKNYLLHRLAFLYMTGKTPRFVDHINGNRSDNRWENLRACTHQQNCSNIKYVRSKPGFKGVFESPRANGVKYRAAIGHKKKRIWLGTFDTPEEAHAAYIAKAQELNGEFAHPGSEKKTRPQGS